LFAGRLDTNQPIDLAVLCGTKIFPLRPDRNHLCDIKIFLFPPVVFPGRLDTNQPIDLAALCGTKIFPLRPDRNHFGFHLTSDGADSFQADLWIQSFFYPNQDPDLGLKSYPSKKPV
jgi:hypothetical protein